jgi:hypothetical protein
MGMVNESSSELESELSCMSPGGSCDGDKQGLEMLNEVSGGSVGRIGRTLLSDDRGSQFELEISTVESGRGDTCKQSECKDDLVLVGNDVIMGITSCGMTPSVTSCNFELGKT